MEKDQAGEVLSVLFPGEKVEIGKGQTVVVRPLTLADLPKVMSAFSAIMRLAEKGMLPSDIAVAGVDELLKILPHCITRPPEEIPVVAVPEIIEIVLKQNVTDASVGKWKALIQKLVKSLPSDLSEKLPLGQSKRSRK